ncbi:protein kinase family protein [Roseococcus pinisoli]|uniref:Phosphotransferase n=1 Tax=Roseococcus pinisoli TaxID=2835040 RepID=A0ABS5QIS4_9PROT|nr:phosphotransferase [Roseococcus pinisoli]MBS7813585.1 phosphotransferase [Roseococcus pinisoli]
MTTEALPPGIDAAFLTEALHRSGLPGGGRVREVAVRKSFPTLLSHIFRLRLDHDGAAAGFPETLILKAGLAGRPGGPWKFGSHEVAFYQKVAPATPPGLLPRCYDAASEAETGTWHLLLEDLTDSHRTATPWPLPPDLADGQAIMRARARFHAAWWDHPRLGVDIGSWPDAAGMEGWLQEMREKYARFAEQAGDGLSAGRRELYARLFEAAPRLGARYRSHRHMTIIHGDAHIWNCFLPKTAGQGEARLFDWDGWSLDVATVDLAYMMAIHWYPEMRRRFEGPLLDTYHTELLACGVRGYDRAALQEDYRLSVLWQITTPVWQHALGIPPLIWWNNLERVHMAAEDLDCRALLG